MPASSQGRDQHLDVPLEVETGGVEFGDLFINERGELVNDKLTLTVDSDQGETWQQWGGLVVPRTIFQEFGLTDTEGSERWANVVEHSMFVAGSAVTVGRQLIEAGATPGEVDLETTLRAAIVHDAAKRLDVKQKDDRTRALEPYDFLLASVLMRHGFSYAEIAAASNTGRPADRFITDPDQRMQHIKAKSIPATLVGYCDARTRETRCLTLEEACEESVMVKPDSEAFFRDHWLPYYKAVEEYLVKKTEGSWSPDQLTQEAIYDTVEDIVAVHAKYGQVFGAIAGLATKSSYDRHV